MIDYRAEDVAQAALNSPCAPFAVVLDCVGGKDLIAHMENLVLHDPMAPQLGIYVTIVGDSASLSLAIRTLISYGVYGRDESRFHGWWHHECSYSSSR